MSVQIQVRRDTAANWTTEDPTLAAGEFGWETDTNKLKIGDGSTAWTSLDYFEPTPASGVGSNLTAFKAADETVTSSSALQDDDHLSFAIGANERWVAEFGLLLVAASATPDYKIGVSGPAGAAGSLAHIGLSVGATSIQDNGRWHHVPWTQATEATDTVTAGAPTTTPSFTLVKFHILAGVTAGTVRLRWAQGAANASGCTIKAGSWLVATRLA